MKNCIEIQNELCKKREREREDLNATKTSNKQNRIWSSFDNQSFNNCD